MNKDSIKWKKHLEACRKWRENNRNRYRQISLQSARKKKEKNPEEYLELMRQRAKKYRLENLKEHKAKEKEYSRLWRLQATKEDKENVKKYMRSYRLKGYNLTSEEYEKMLSNQSGKCAICKKDFVRRPHIDHCHKTGRVRGLLCTGCNLQLGCVENGQKNKKKFRGIYRDIITNYLK